MTSKKDYSYVNTRYQYKLGDNARNKVRLQHYILLLLWRRGPLTSHEILGYLHEAKYNVRNLRDLHSRIYYLRQSKLIERDGDGKYRLTEKGEKYAEELSRIYLDFAKSSEKIRNTLANIELFSSIEDVLKTYHKRIEDKLSKILEEIEEIFRLNEDEKAIMEYLFEYLKYSMLIDKKTKSAYVYANMILRDLGFNPVYLKELINTLQSKGLVYVYSQGRGQPARIGLKPELVKEIWEVVRGGSSIHGSTSLRQTLLKLANTSLRLGKQLEQTSRNEAPRILHRIVQKV